MPFYSPLSSSDDDTPDADEAAFLNLPEIPFDYESLDLPSHFENYRFSYTPFMDAEALGSTFIIELVLEGPDIQNKPEQRHGHSGLTSGIEQHSLRRDRSNSSKGAG